MGPDRVEGGGRERASDEARRWVSLMLARYCPTCREPVPASEPCCLRDGTPTEFASVPEARGDDPPSGAIDRDDGDLRFTTDFLLGLMGGSESADDRPPGKVLGGKWRTLRVLGEGCFSVVYLGEHTILGMKVAIKALRGRFTESKSGRQLFHQEAMRLSRLDHPNIVKVLDYGEDSGRPYLVTEYLSGEALSDRIRRGDLSLEDGVEVIRQVATALVRAHGSAGSPDTLVHLDLKPEHIFLETIRGRLHSKVIDFGIAEICGLRGRGEDGSPAARAAGSAIVGTPPYMAPERWLGAVDPRCDIYSLGTILYEVVAGRRPFAARTLRRMRTLHESCTPAPPSHRRPGPATRALRELDDIVLRCLAKRPEDRPGSADALVKALEEWQRTPRLTPRQRAARAVRMGLLAFPLLLLPTALVLYLAPWESVRIFPGQPSLLLGPRTREPPSSDFQALACGYGTALLEARRPDGRWIVARDLSPALAGWRDGVLPTPDWRTVEVVLPPWEAFESILGPIDDEREISGRLTLRGALGRTLRSPPFPIRLDPAPPRLEEVEGRPASPEGEAAGCAVVRVAETAPGHSTILRFSEPVTPPPSDGRVDWKTGGSATDVRCDLGREVLVSNPRIRLDGVEDLAGNRCEHPGLCVAVVRPPPPLVHPPGQSILTSGSELELAWSSRPGRASVRVGGVWNEARILEPVDEVGGPAHHRYWHAAIPLPALEREEGRETLSVVTVKTWPPDETEAGDAVAPAEEEVTIRRLRRDLQVVEEEGSKEGLRWMATNRSGRVEEPLEWSGFALLTMPDGTSDAIELGPVQAAVLDLGGQRDLLSRRGRYVLMLSARDAYGNAAPHAKAIRSIGVDPPRLLGAELRDDGGNPVLELHNIGCSCNLEASRGLEIRCDFEYGFADELDWQAAVGPRPIPVLVGPVAAGGASLRVLRRAVLEALSGSTGAIAVRAEDRVTKARSNLVELPVAQHPPLEVDLTVSHPTDAGTVTVEVAVIGGPTSLAGLRVETPVGPGTFLEARRAEDESRWIATDAPIHLVGRRTEFRAVGRLGSTADACLLPAVSPPVPYAPQPIPGRIYTFRAGGLELELQYCRTTSRGGFWHTSPRSCAKILAACRKIAKVPADSTSASRGEGIGFSDACWMAGRVNEVFAKVLGPKAGFRLARLDDLEDLRREGATDMLPEWLDPEDPRVDETLPEFAHYAVAAPGGGLIWQRARKEKDSDGRSWSQFCRLVLRPDEGLEPVEADSSRKAP